jgi:hypothetical protein
MNICHSYWLCSVSSLQSPVLSTDADNSPCGILVCTSSAPCADVPICIFDSASFPVATSCLILELHSCCSHVPFYFLHFVDSFPQIQVTGLQQGCPLLDSFLLSEHSPSGIPCRISAHSVSAYLYSKRLYVSSPSHLLDTESVLFWSHFHRKIINSNLGTNYISSMSQYFYFFL